jgi:hypothetical protein
MLPVTRDERPVEKGGCMARTAMMLLAAVFVLGGLNAPSLAVPVHVPGDQPTIQAGIDHAAEGDTVLVAPNTYRGVGNRELDFGGVNVVVMSEAGPSQTIIDCEGAGAAFLIWQGEGPSSVISGFGITNGSRYTGAAIHVDHSATTIENCVFYGNVADSNGGGIAYAYAPVAGAIRDCTFYGNTAEYRAGGILCDASTVDITDCLFYENTVTTTLTDPWYGGGALLGNSSTVTATNCTFVRNAASTGAGGVHAWASNVTVENSIIAFSAEGPAAGNAILSQCVVFGNAGGDRLSPVDRETLIMDPNFCDMANDDYTLCADSPCLAGSLDNPWGVHIGALEQGCGDCGSVVTPTSWGRVKATYR